jgi:hypothetical protein
MRQDTIKVKVRIGNKTDDDGEGPLSHDSKVMSPQTLKGITDMYWKKGTHPNFQDNAEEIIEIFGDSKIVKDVINVLRGNKGRKPRVTKHYLTDKPTRKS